MSELIPATLNDQIREVQQKDLSYRLLHQECICIIWRVIPLLKHHSLH